MRVFGPAILLCISFLLPTFSQAADDPTATAAPAATVAAPTPAAEPQPKPLYSSDGFQLGVGVKVSTLGIGGEVAYPILPHINIRAGVNAFNYNHTFNESNISYVGTLKLLSAQATLDLYAFGSFHISPGALLYSDNRIDANASVPGNSSFTLNSVNYVSDPANPTHGTATMTLAKAAPMVLMGFGNLVPRSASRHLSISVETGVVFQGSPRVHLNLTGNACDAPGINCRNVANDPTFQSNAQAEETNLTNKAKPFKYYPVISLGFGWKF